MTADPPESASQGTPGSQHTALEGYLDGQILIAMPVMSDPRFERTLIYLCAHSEEGAMGLVINKPAENINFEDLLEKLSIDVSGDAGPGEIELPPVLVGGPVDMGRGFVLHSQDFRSETSTLNVTDTIGLTSTVDILRSIAEGKGPKHVLLALGYSGWGAGQLEQEIQSNGWLHCETDEDLLFGRDLEGKYTRALTKLGVDVSALSGRTGEA